MGSTNEFDLGHIEKPEDCPPSLTCLLFHVDS
jgi:hypothetical protein